MASRLYDKMAVTQLAVGSRQLAVSAWSVQTARFRLLTADCRTVELLLFFLLFLVKTNAQPCREVIGYFPSWKWYDRQQLVNPATIAYGNYTTVNYAFFEPNPDGSISPFDPLADKTILLGEISPSAPPGYGRRKDFGKAEWHVPGTSLVYRAHVRGVKVFVSVGGWTMSHHFSDIAASAEKRRRFASSCNEMVRTYALDGIDIDWEYPGFRTQGGSADDRENFTLLLREVRDSLDDLQFFTGRQLYLSAAFGAAPTRMADIEWGEVAHLLDFINVMTYDFYGRDFSVTNHNSPLYPPAQGIEGYDSHSTVQYLVERFGVPPSKICLGVPFYGRSLRTKNSPGLHVASRQATDSATFPEDDGAPAFYNILARQGRFFYEWDSLAQAPFLRGKNLNTFVSFDDERSVAQKARYIVEYQLAGAIVWDITGDCVESKIRRGTIERTPLADALRAALCGQGEFFAQAGKPATAGRLALLPQRGIFVRLRTFSPRVAVKPDVSKKEKKKKRKQKRRKGGSPERYFDSGH
ncbi:MAG: glycoside hydrolase family 18 protein [Bacteroidetes bacterium]|nr:glycoside hydrolase family 18 protein [Bacteroidota bacterium]